MTDWHRTALGLLRPLHSLPFLVRFLELSVTGWRPMKPPAMPEATSPLNSRGQNTRSTASMVQRAFTLMNRVNSRHYSEGCKRSEEHTSELQSLAYLVCRLLLERT